MEKKWKYQNPKKEKTYDHYLRFDGNEKKKLKITNWDFTKNPATDSLMQCDVGEENGEKVDKIWSVWNYELTQELKKKLKGKNPKQEVELTIIRHEKDMEESFEVK